jgi:hypothetical protein
LYRANAHQFEGDGIPSQAGLGLLLFSLRLNLKPSELVHSILRPCALALLLIIDSLAVMLHFSTFPRTEPPAPFVESVVAVFRKHATSVATMILPKGLSSDAVMATLRADLCELGFEIEAGKGASSKLKRPVFFGQDGRPSRQYEIDGFHPGWQCGIEIEAGRAWMGNAVYRDLIQALVMVDLSHLILAVPLGYRYFSRGNLVVSKDYENTLTVADALYTHTRIRMPYRLTVIGY